MSERIVALAMHLTYRVTFERSSRGYDIGRLPSPSVFSFLSPFNETWAPGQAFPSLLESVCWQESMLIPFVTRSRQFVRVCCLLVKVILQFFVLNNAPSSRQ
jgi:hypothetical protein